MSVPDTLHRHLTIVTLSVPENLRHLSFTRQTDTCDGPVKVTVCHTAGHYGEEYDDWNSDVRSRRNCSSDGAERTGRAASDYIFGT